MQQSVPLADYLTGRHVRLEPIGNSNVEQLYSWATAGDIIWQWHGHPIGADGFRQSMWTNTLAHFVCRSQSSSTAFGLVSAYGANFHHQFCYFQMGVVPDCRLRGWPLEAAFLMFRYLFSRFGFRKIYLEVAEGNLAQFHSVARRIFTTEGVLSEHLLIDGVYQDVHILALSRAQWEVHRVRFERVSS